jgi:hypothetical protein
MGSQAAAPWCRSVLHADSRAALAAAEATCWVGARGRGAGVVVGVTVVRCHTIAVLLGDIVAWSGQLVCCADSAWSCPRAHTHVSSMSCCLIACHADNEHGYLMPCEATPRGGGQGDGLYCISLRLIITGCRG